MNVNKLVIKISIFLVSVVGISILALWKKEKSEKEYCTLTGSCIILDSRWEEVVSMRSANAILLMEKFKKNQMEIYFLDGSSKKVQPHDYLVRINYSWGGVAELSENSEFRKNFGDSGVLKNRRFLIEQRAFIECSDWNCLDSIKGFDLVK